MKKIENKQKTQGKQQLPAEPISIVFLEDCLKGMKRYCDNYFDLAVVDPPYGLDMGTKLSKCSQKNRYKKHMKKDWDKQVPGQDYFDELFRVSRNQIVFGGNYMTEYLPVSRGWIVWDKGQGCFSFSDGELAWTSFNRVLRIFYYARGYESGLATKLRGTERAGLNIHPTQKPIGLYDWIFANYSERGQIILDTHVGSGSSRIAANKAGLNYVGFEIDKDYYESQEKRYQTFISQIRLF